MKKDNIYLLVLFFLLFLSFGFLILNSYHPKGNRFEYVDYKYNTGLATDCETVKGSMYCTLEDNTKVQVIQYKMIKSTK